MDPDALPVGPATLACQRASFSLSTGTHYLNCAYMSPLSQVVRQAGAAGMLREADPTTITAPDFFAGPDEVRRAFAQIIDLGDPTRVALMPAASYGLATVARNTPVEAGQNVVLLHEQFPSNVHAWRRLCRDKDAQVRIVEAPEAGPTRAAGWNEAILEAIDRDTALVAVEAVHWTDGTRFDLESIGERAREVGAAFVVDGTQSVGAEPFDVRRIRPDALVCSGYKWLTGPYSLAVAYYGSRYDGGVPLEETWGARAGSEDFAGLVRQVDAYRPGAARYDMGEAAGFTLVPMLAAAMRQVLAWGAARIAAYLRHLREPIHMSGRLERLGIAADPSQSAHLFGLRLPAATDPKQLAARLAGLGVHVSVRGRVVRVSPHVFNDSEDIEALLAGIEEGVR